MKIEPLVAKIFSVAVISVAFLSIVGSSVFYLDAFLPSAPNDSDPLKAYFANPGIFSIRVSALALNFAICALIFRRTGRGAETNALFFILFVNSILPWLELWHGSNFYYGEVRDKQGLPYGVVNFGPIGTTLFLSYIAFHIPTNIKNSFISLVLRVAVVASVFEAQHVLLSLVSDTWNLWQS